MHIGVSQVASKSQATTAVKATASVRRPVHLQCSSARHGRLAQGLPTARRVYASSFFRGHRLFGPGSCVVCPPNAQEIIRVAMRDHSRMAADAGRLGDPDQRVSDVEREQAVAWLQHHLVPVFAHGFHFVSQRGRLISISRRSSSWAWTPAGLGIMAGLPSWAGIRRRSARAWKMVRPVGRAAIVR